MKRYMVMIVVILFAEVFTAQANDFRTYAGIGAGAFGIEYKEPGFSQKNTMFGGFAKFGVDVNEYVGAVLE